MVLVKETVVVEIIIAIISKEKNFKVENQDVIYVVKVRAYCGKKFVL